MKRASSSVNIKTITSEPNYANNVSFVKNYESSVLPDKPLKSNYDSLTSTNTIKQANNFENIYSKNYEKINEASNLMRTTKEVVNRNYEMSHLSLQQRKNSLKQQKSPRDINTVPSYNLNNSKH